MYTNKKTIANSPYDEALSELRAAVPNLQAIADRAFALAAANEFEGPRRNIERVGIRTADLITQFPDLCNGDRLPRCNHVATRRERAMPRMISKTDSASRGISIFMIRMGIRFGKGAISDIICEGKFDTQRTSGITRRSTSRECPMSRISTS